MNLPPDQNSSKYAQAFFSPDQRPIYLSLTSACTWHLSQTERKDPTKIACDTATAYIFPLHKYLGLEFDRERTQTIGHLYPLQKKVPVGTTHELEVNGDRLDGRTTYEHAADPRRSECAIVDGALAKAKARNRLDNHDPYPSTWDTGWKPYRAQYDQEEELMPTIDPLNPTRDKSLGQYRNSQFRIGNFRNGPGYINVARVHEPFWNMRVLDSAIEGHNGYVSYPTWCGLNQLILDDIICKGMNAYMRSADKRFTGKELCPGLPIIH